MPEGTNESDKAGISTPTAGQVGTSPDSEITSAQLEKLLRGIPPAKESREAETEESETTEVEEKEEKEEEKPKQQSKWETFISELGFKDLDAIAHSYKEMQRRATRAEEELKSLRERVPQQPSQQEAPQQKTMTMEEFQELLTEKPLEALDLHYRQRSKEQDQRIQQQDQRIQQLETALYIQHLQRKHPDFDIEDHEEEIIEIYKKHPGLYGDPTGLELVVELVKKREQEAMTKKQIEEAKKMGRLEAEETIREKEKAAGIVSRQSVKSLPDISKMTAAELEQLLPKAQI